MSIKLLWKTPCLPISITIVGEIASAPLLSPSYMPSPTASLSRHLALLHPETPPTRPFSFSFFFLRCFLNFLSSHVVLLHHETPTFSRL